MQDSKRIELQYILAGVVLALTGAVAQAKNSSPNPYDTVEGCAKLPERRACVATSAVYPAPDGKNIWVAEC